LGELYVQGLAVDWAGFDCDYSRRYVILPTYPFQRRRFWPSGTRSWQAQIPAKQANGIDDWFYQVQWQPSVTPQEQPGEPGLWLILSDQGGVGTSLTRLLEQSGERCLSVYPDSIDPANPADFRRLCEEAQQTATLKGVVHLWSLDTANTAELTSISLDQAVALSCGSVLHLVQALATRESSPRLTLVTRNAAATGKEPDLSLAQAPIWGLGKVIALEHPSFWGGMVDLGSEPLADQAASLFAEIYRPRGEDQIAIRGGQAYAARLVRTSPPTVRSFELRNDGTYLITGGLGALGLQVAGWLVEHGARHLVLSGRRTASPEATVEIEKLVKAGTEVHVINADVSKESDLSRLFAEAKQSLPPIRGVVHAAGILDDGILLRQDWKRFSKVLAPKVTGAWNLHVLTRDMPLDFFVLFSSAAALVGVQGQGNYVAGNSFLDSLAPHRRAEGLPALSINWGPWAQEGMAATLGRRFKDLGMGLIARDQGLLALQRLLGTDQASAGVLSVDWRAFGRQFTAASAPSIIAELVPKSERADSDVLRAMEESDAPEALLRKYVREEVSRILDLGPSEGIGPHQGFSDLGMDSLMAIELKNRLEASLSTSLPTTLALEYPTVESLVEYLGSKVRRATVTSTSAIQPRSNNGIPDAVLADVQKQSTDKLKEFIDQELQTLLQ
jgi:acyl transferase domain-containing protein